MSIIISSLLIFFLCLPTHTCNARDLGVLIDHSNYASHKKLPLSNKALESVKQLNRDDTISVHDEGTSEDNIVFHDSHVVKPKDSDSLHRELMKPKRDISAAPVPVKPFVSVSGRVPRKNLDERTENFKPFTQVGLLWATSIEDSRRRGLSIVVVEHGSESHVKEDRSDNKAYQLTDYDSPHQKPPIDNRLT